MPWIDVLGSGLLLIFLVLGLLRGLWWQVIRLVGVVAAVTLARALGPVVRPALRNLWPEMPSRVAHGLAWVAIFVAVMIAATLLARLGRKALEALALGLFDRVGGAVVGALTGLLLHTAFLVVLCHLAPREFVRSTLKGSRSRHLVHLVATKWPVLVDRKAGDDLRLFMGTGPLPGVRSPGRQPPGTLPPNPLTAPGGKPAGKPGGKQGAAPGATPGATPGTGQRLPEEQGTDAWADPEGGD